MPTDGQSIQLLAKAAQLLDRLAEEGDASAARLVELTSEPKTSVYRLLRGLQDLGYVEPGEAPATFRLGIKLFRLGSVAVAQLDQRRLALPAMEHINRETEETVYLCVRRGFEAVCVERIDGRWVSMMAFVLGGALPLHVGAAPQALLANEPDAVRRAYLAHAGITARAATRRISASLTQIRNQGYVIADGDVVVGMAAVGAPIFNHHGAVSASLSVSGPSPKLLAENTDATVAAVLAGAREISKKLGYRPTDDDSCNRLPGARALLP